jgi:hypothetical protein
MLENEIYFIAEKLNKKWIKSFKQLGNNPIQLTRSAFINKILPDIDNYYLTEKADGLRCFLIIKNNIVKYITSTNIEYLNINIPFSDDYIFDCELVNGVVYIFDVILYNGINLSNSIFSDRYLKLLEFQSYLNKNNISNISIKKFHKLLTKSYQKDITQLYKSYITKTNVKYNIDGLIFVENGKNYLNTANLKWKPTNLLTIDFLAIEISKDKYILLNGISKDMATEFGLQTNKKYNDILKVINGLGINIKDDYIPIPFYNSLIPNIYFYESKLNIHGHIVELSLDDKLNWVFHKIRTDRDIELQNGTYYGNNYKVAESTLQSILNPLLFKDLITPINILNKDVYFQKQDDMYKDVKKFNNKIKEILIEKYLGQDKDGIIMDLGAGRGGDLYKYVNIGVKNLLALEYDNNAIDTLLERKYSILKTLGPEFSCNLSIIQMDLNSTYTNNVKIIDEKFTLSDTYMDILIPKNNNISTIFCHFALHYMLNSAKSANNIARFVSHYLKKDRTFTATIFDGALVYDFLKKNGGSWIAKENGKDKYIIKYKGSSKDIKSMKDSKEFSGFDHKIDILLPLSNQLYEEPLIDINALDKIFKSHNMINIETKSFSDTNGFTESNMSKDDKTFVSFYKYIVYKKI